MFLLWHESVCDQFWQKIVWRAKVQMLFAQRLVRELGMGSKKSLERGGCATLRVRSLGRFCHNFKKAQRLPGVGFEKRPQVLSRQLNKICNTAHEGLLSPLSQTLCSKAFNSCCEDGTSKTCSLWPILVSTPKHKKFQRRVKQSDWSPHNYVVRKTAALRIQHSLVNDRSPPPPKKCCFWGMWIIVDKGVL